MTAAPLAAFASNPDHAVGDAFGLLLVSELLVTGAWMIGYSVRQQRAYTASLAEQAERRAREQLAEARRASSEERLQIARELHDVVAHTMSLIAVQAGVANYVVTAHPQEAARALSSIEQTSRGALREMRALLDAPGRGGRNGTRAAGGRPGTCAGTGRPRQPGRANGPGRRPGGPRRPRRAAPAFRRA